MVNFRELIGKTIIKIEGLEKGSYEVIFTCSDNLKYKMFHECDCSEEVYIDDIIGDIEDLLNTPVLNAEEISNEIISNGIICERGNEIKYTFYKLSTIKGYLDIKWYGESNGFYSIDVNLICY